MPCGSEIDADRRLVSVHAWGVFTQSEATAIRLNFVNDPRFEQSFFQVYDLTDVTEVSMTASEIRDLASVTVFSHNSRRAFVAPSDVSYGLARMFATFREVVGGHEEIEIFRSRPEADEWLGLKT